MEFKFHEIETITNNFSADLRIGSGGYGDVYKGVYNGEEIAVKKFYPPPGLDEKEFDNEFRNLSKIRHKNVVRLIGYCCETRHKYLEHNGDLVFASVMERVLCFEYMHGGSLDKHISDEHCDLDWSTCYKIIKGTCEGLDHLHNEQGRIIFHLDLKPANILLDKNMTAKITDLSLSRLCASSEDFMDDENRRGTFGHMPPEYINDGIISTKFDVFSLGATILKILAGREGYSLLYEMPGHQFVELVTENWKKRLQGTSQYPSQEIEILAVKTCVEIALRCVKADRKERPSVREIINKLEDLDLEIKSRDLLITRDKIQDFKLPLLETITNNFSDENKVGSGGYGDVYRGVYNWEEIAVKKLHPLQGLDDKVFENEVRNLWKVHHKNVVRLIGYCHDIQHKFLEYKGELIYAQQIERVLCFEYMQGGSLDKHISDESCDLDWPTCYKIVFSICEGLNHLHNAQGRPIFHLDLKPHKVLLDKDMTAKIAGFGLSRQVDPTETDVRTESLQGTQEYMPPEYIDSGRVSEKFDVYSLGVTILQIMAGNTARSRHAGMSQGQFIEIVTESWKVRLRGTLRSLETDIKRLEKCVEIALRCVEFDPIRRPSINEIINELEGLEADIIEGMSVSSHRSKDILPRTEDVCIELKMLESILGGSKKPRNLRLATLEFITKKFSPDLIIGYGGCAEVYKVNYFLVTQSRTELDLMFMIILTSKFEQGNLGNGNIAVKKLFSSHTKDDKMFHQEVQSLMMVNHKNVVRFLGFCSHTEEEAHKSDNRKYLMAESRTRLLCFEYMDNGSLDNYVTDELRGLDWQLRYQIINGICDGLHHLHNEHIIHLDLKPANILLDKRMMPKITDFGLSRFDDKSQTLSLDRLVSLGYCAPEYQHDGKMSAKSDIYSLGVIIRELVTGSRKKPDITKAVCRRWKHRWSKSGMDTHLWCKQVVACLDLAQRCTHKEPAYRPDIGDITGDLKKVDSCDMQMNDATEYLKLEDMVGVNPLEIKLPFELNKQTSCCFELSNDTDDHFAFRILTTSLRPYCIKENQGTLSPRSKCSVTITLQEPKRALQDNYNRDEFIVQSTKVDDGNLTAMDIRDIFRDEPGNKVVDTVSLTVILIDEAMSPSGER